MDELVFTVPTVDCWNLITYKEQGLIYGNGNELKMIVQKGLFRKRNESEEDPSFKQIIPYAVISNQESFYLFRRAPGQTEKRLQHKFSLGVGGHMNPSSSTELNEQYLIDELRRELFEEVRLFDGCSIADIEFIGFINDDTIPVGRVHIGLLFNIRVSNKNVYVNETNKMTGAWVEKSNLAGFYEGMETWTRIVFDQYIK